MEGEGGEGGKISAEVGGLIEGEGRQEEGAGAVDVDGREEEASQELHEGKGQRNPPQPRAWD